MDRCVCSSCGGKLCLIQETYSDVNSDGTIDYPHDSSDELVCFLCGYKETKYIITIHNTIELQD